MKKLILADDSYTIQRMALFALSMEHIEMFSFCNGDDVLKYLPTIKPDIVVAGTRIDGKNGYEICDFIKHQSSNSEIPVLLLRSRFDPPDQDRMSAVECDGVLVKPFRTQELVEKVVALLKKPIQAMNTGDTAPPVPELSAKQKESQVEAVDSEIPEAEKEERGESGLLFLKEEELLPFIDPDALWNLALTGNNLRMPVSGESAGVEEKVTVNPPEEKALKQDMMENYGIHFSDSEIESISQKMIERVSDNLSRNLSPTHLKKIFKEVIVEVFKKD